MNRRVAQTRCLGVGSLRVSCHPDLESVVPERTSGPNTSAVGHTPSIITSPDLNRFEHPDKAGHPRVVSQSLHPLDRRHS